MRIDAVKNVNPEANSQAKTIHVNAIFLKESVRVFFAAAAPDTCVRLLNSFS